MAAAVDGEQHDRLDARPKVLALASAGGHWVQLLRMRRAFDGCDVVYVSTRPDCHHDVAGERFRLVPDANRWNKLQAARCAAAVARLVLVERPDVIVSTGALPGYFSLVVGKVVGAHTIWIDSVANAEELSMSGQRAGRKADLWLTQWEHLATADGPSYAGSVFG